MTKTYVKRKVGSKKGKTYDRREKLLALFLCLHSDSSRLELRKGKAKGEDGGPLSEVDTTRAKGKTLPCTRVKETCIEQLGGQWFI